MENELCELCYSRNRELDECFHCNNNVCENCRSYDRDDGTICNKCKEEACSRCDSDFDLGKTKYYCSVCGFTLCSTCATSSIYGFGAVCCQECRKVQI